jgi:hypothetical protein
MADELVEQMTRETDPEVLQAQTAAFCALADRCGLEPDSVKLRALAAFAANPSIPPDAMSEVTKAWLLEEGLRDADSPQGQTTPALTAPSGAERPKP